ncbi:MAG: Cu(I)/Ag(I) efflux system membrane fusion protein [Candidatus Omnitrophota bacterium]|jgi:Cu(I)/Ag(I) efflux system membrane fusion protein
MESKKQAKPKLRLVILITGAMVIGWTASSLMNNNHNSNAKNILAEQGSQKQASVWTCSMHPQIQLPKPGKCPICGMSLIPIETEESEGMPSERRLVMSPDAMQIADIQTEAVKRKFVTTQIRMVGKVEYDETRIAYITAWTGGRIDRLYIDQTGTPVKKGDHMAYIYSPELLSAQEEYLQSLESVDSVKASHLDIIKSTSASTVENSRAKLKLLGITEQQIKELEERKKPNDHMTIYATANGIVTKREVQQGDYIKTGSRIYSIVDLSNVWIKLDAYEADLQWLRHGQQVRFEAEAYPGDYFKGRISFISPVLDEMTRTVKVRVNIDNTDGRLKPGMFVRAIVDADIADGGRVMDEYLRGKWIGPMHPEIIRDEPGNCPICEMPLVPTESMGYVSSGNVEMPLAIPASAVLKTGKRAIVYVKTPNVSKPTFEGREIVLGTRAGDDYIVKSGLVEGELIVTHGNFKIDSALQIQAKPSMMNPEGGSTDSGHGSHSHGGEHEH